jgi:hypothetical protein
MSLTLNLYTSDKRTIPVTRLMPSKLGGGFHNSTVHALQPRNTKQRNAKQRHPLQSKGHQPTREAHVQDHPVKESTSLVPLMPLVRVANVGILGRSPSTMVLTTRTKLVRFVPLSVLRRLRKRNSWNCDAQNLRLIGKHLESAGHSQVNLSTDSSR